MKPSFSSLASVLFAVSLVTASVAACEDKKTENRPPPPPIPVTADTSGSAIKTTYDPSQLAVFQPLPPKLELPDNPLTDDKVALGRQLFFDARLSKGQDVSCNSCHDVSKNGADAAAHSTGTKKQTTHYNAPTVFNAAGGFAQGWETRVTTIEEQVVAHSVEPTIMGLADDKKLGEIVSSIPGYVTSFKKVFPTDKTITSELVSKAMGAYMRKLITPSPWDKFLGGDATALTDEQKTGLAVFLDVGCQTCHAGKYMGATQNQKLGLAKPWEGDAGKDPGRFEATKQPIDKGMFKVPSLRNVTKTSPYLHDGSVGSLEEMAKLMAFHQVGKTIDEARAKSVASFLGALAGDPPKDLISKPDLPPSGPKTPKPE